jgi:hypothetical protein
MCDYCGADKCNHDMIGIFPPDMVAWRRSHVLCPMCEGFGTVTMEHWKNPKPCAVCMGVGQINKKLIPHPMVMIEMVVKVLPPRVTPSRPVPEGQ